jgi:hypothetical protein
MIGLVSMAQATITINLSGGTLYGADTNSPLPLGTLVQLIASRTTGSGFDIPSVGSYTGNSADDIVLANFAVNNAVGNPGTFSTVVEFSLGNGVDVGDQLLLRWFPGLTIVDSAPSSPNQTFGQFRVDIVQDFSDINWTVPADASLVFLNFFTQMNGGVNPESAGVANMVVAVPEPSTGMLLAFGAVAAVLGWRRLKHVA